MKSKKKIVKRKTSKQKIIDRFSAPQVEITGTTTDGHEFVATVHGYTAPKPSNDWLSSFKCKEIMPLPSSTSFSTVIKSLKKTAERLHREWKRCRKEAHQDEAKGDKSGAAFARAAADEFETQIAACNQKIEELKKDQRGMKPVKVQGSDLILPLFMTRCTEVK